MSKQNIKNIAILIVAIIGAACFNLNLDTSVSIRDAFTSVDSILLMSFFLILFIALKQIVELKDKRARIVSVIVAVIFAGLEVVGYSISNYNSLAGVIGSKEILLKAVLKFIGYAIVFYTIIIYVYTKVLPRIKLKEDNKIRKYFTDNKRSLFVIALILFIAYLPHFLYNFPGMYTSDSIAEMDYGLNNATSFKNHHPVFHIFIIYGCISLGKLLGGAYIGIAIYSILQMVFVSFSFSYVLKYMAKKNVNIVFRILTLIFFIIYPSFGPYSITMWKDVPFGIMLVLFTIQVIEMVTNKEYFIKKRNIVSFIIISIFTILFRNNGLYVVLITLATLLIFLRGNRKKIALILLVVILFNILWKGPIFKLLNVTDGPIREMMSIPVQQIARTVKYRRSELTEEEKTKIQKYIDMDLEEMSESYYPLISDNIKDHFNNEEFNNNKLDFISLWVSLFFKYPVEYIEAFFDNSFGYWYPQANNGILPTWYKYEESEEMIGYDRKPAVNLEFLDGYYADINGRKMPIISMWISIGFVFWIMILFIGYIVYTKKYKLILAYIPILSLWLTTIASPVYCEYRYIFGMFTCIPILTILMISLSNLKEDKENKQKIKEIKESKVMENKNNEEGK